jgi:general stress protein CsbA
MTIINRKCKENVLFQILPLFLVLFIFVFTQNEFFVTAGIIFLITLSFMIKYYKKEWKVLVFGVILGIIFELGGDLIYKAQYWENASFFGIPIWLPLMWGYGFIFIRRIGNFLVKNKKNKK